MLGHVRQHEARDEHVLACLTIPTVREERNSWHKPWIGP